MALTATVTKKSVNLTQPKLYSITFNLVVLSGETEVINKDFAVEYHTGDNVANKVATVKNMMQAEIDKYKAEQTIFTAAAMDTAVNSISGGLSL